MNLSSMNAYLMAEKKQITICDNKTFEVIQKQNINPSGQADDDIQVLSIAVSHNEKKIAILLGKVLIRDAVEMTEIAVYINDANEGERPRFKLEKLRDWDSNDKACVNFQFDKFNDKMLIFFKSNAVIKFDYADEGGSQTIINDNFDIQETPIWGVFNENQDKFIVTGSKSMYFVDTQSNEVIDLAEQEKITSIQNILPHKNMFYILANKQDGRLGYYLMAYDSNKAGKYDEYHRDEVKGNPNRPEYLIRWSNKLDIGCCDLQLMKEGNSESIVVSYKCIGINTYNIFVIDLKTKLIQYWHESY